MEDKTFGSKATLVRLALTNPGGKSNEDITSLCEGRFHSTREGPVLFPELK